MYVLERHGHESTEYLACHNNNHRFSLRRSSLSFFLLTPILLKWKSPSEKVNERKPFFIDLTWFRQPPKLTYALFFGCYCGTARQMRRNIYFYFEREFGWNGQRGRKGEEELLYSTPNRIQLCTRLNFGIWNQCFSNAASFVVHNFWLSKCFSHIISAWERISQTSFYSRRIFFAVATISVPLSVARTEQKYIKRSSFDKYAWKKYIAPNIIYPLGRH